MMKEQIKIENETLEVSKPKKVKYSLKEIRIFTNKDVVNYMSACIKLTGDLELQGLLLGKVETDINTNLDSLVIYKAILLECHVTSASAHSNGLQVSKAFTPEVLAYMREKKVGIVGYWHSHGTMNPFFSSTDIGTINEMIELGQPFFFSIVGANSLEFKNTYNHQNNYSLGNKFKKVAKGFFNKITRSSGLIKVEWEARLDLRTQFGSKASLEITVPYKTVYYDDIPKEFFKQAQKDLNRYVSEEYLYLDSWNPKTQHNHYNYYSGVYNNYNKPNKEILGDFEEFIKQEANDSFILNQIGLETPTKEVEQRIKQTKEIRYENGKKIITYTEKEETEPEESIINDSMLLEDLNNQFENLYAFCPLYDDIEVSIIDYNPSLAWLYLSFYGYLPFDEIEFEDFLDDVNENLDACISELSENDTLNLREFPYIPLAIFGLHNIIIKTEKELNDLAFRTLEALKQVRNNYWGL